MAIRLIIDRAGLFTCKVASRSKVLNAALGHRRADSLLRCATITALTALARGGEWPDRVMLSLAALLSQMRAEVSVEQHSGKSRGGDV
ncbi:MAG: hypothetical protein AB7V27_19275 [Candidatus Binatia bacterium]